MLNPISSGVAAETPAVQDQDDSDRLIYDMAYFDQYAPRTAADMVVQVPGFTLEREPQGQDRKPNRGFSQGQGNLLINGKRPSTKSSSAVELLRRIPASSVVRVEILRQGTSELAGQSGLIVNFITDGEETLTGTFEIQGILRENIARPHASFSLSGKTGNFTFTGELLWDTSTFNFTDAGPETVSDSTGTILELRDERRQITHKKPTLNLGLVWDGENDQVANLNFQGFYSDFEMTETSRQFAPTSNGDFGDFRRTVTNPFLSPQYSYEIGGDYAQPFAGGTLKLIGLRRFDTENRKRISTIDPVDDITTQFESDETADTAETILRILYTLEPAKGQTLEWAIEGALNTLDTSTLFREDLGGGFQPVFIAGSDVFVKENRGETSLLYTRPMTTKLQLQSSVAVEYSKLSAEGTTSNSRSFVRPKGFLALTYDPTNTTQIRTRIDRLVGQLNFRNFASNVDLQEGNQNSGNTELVPEQTWRYEVAVEHRLGAKNVITLTFFHESIEDFITFLSLPGGGGGLGNLTDTRQKRQGIELESTWSTDAIGLKGGKLDISGELLKTRLRDPLTGESRAFDRIRKWRYAVNFRQDIENTAWAWGFSFKAENLSPRHRTDQRSQELVRPFRDSIVFIEHKDILGMTLNLSVDNIFIPQRTLTRDFFDGDRLGEIIKTERRVRTNGTVYQMTLSGKF